MAKTIQRELPAYVYKRRHGYWAQVWNADLQRLIYLGTFLTIAAAQDRVAQAQILIGAHPGKRKERTACRFGHVLIGANVRWYDSWGKRTKGCRRCRLDQQKETQARKKARDQGDA